MQIVLCNNRILAHGENFLAMGGVVINTETGAKYENATVAECEGCPSDINEVGYEYHAGVFVPCAPYGKGNNNGYFMEVCTGCAAPKNSGIPITGGLGLENIDTTKLRANDLGGTEITLLWENAKPTSNFQAQTITLASSEWDFLICESSHGTSILFLGSTSHLSFALAGNSSMSIYSREAKASSDIKVEFSDCYVGNLKNYETMPNSFSVNNSLSIPLKIYGVKI